MQFYLAGRMTGLPEYNFPMFEKAADQLRRNGLKVQSPHEIDHGESPENRGKLPYTKYIRAGLVMLLQCDAIILMDGWELSQGCITEFLTAKACGMDIFFYDPLRGHLTTSAASLERLDASE